MNVQVTPTHSYRAYLRPNGLLSESGVLPFIQLRAPSAEHAARAAHAVTGKAVDSVERIEPAHRAVRDIDEPDLPLLAAAALNGTGPAVTLVGMSLGRVEVPA